MAIKSPSDRRRHSDVQIAVLAKAPLPGYSKTRLIPALGAKGAAQLQRTFIKHTVKTAIAAKLGTVTLWCAPHSGHPLFRALGRRYGVRLLVQAHGDLGERMHMAFRLHCIDGPLLLIGTDCPTLSEQHLHAAADSLLAGNDAVFYPAEDGGYALVGLRKPQAALFTQMPWSTPEVMETTRLRARALGLQTELLSPLWDVDVPEDLARLNELNSVRRAAPAIAGSHA